MVTMWLPQLQVSHLCSETEGVACVIFHNGENLSQEPVVYILFSLTGQAW